MTKTTQTSSAANSFKDKLVSVMQGNLDSEPVANRVSAITVRLKSNPTILSQDVKFEGEISSAGVIEIEGHVKGVVKGNVVALREDGFIEGDVFAESFNIRGKFEGNIRSRSISISSKAKVIGRIEYETLFVEDGAYIDGQFKCLSEK
jgi:cytoskeletal protein CcmA (bactofilin family)